MMLKIFPLLLPLLAKLTTSNTCFGTETLWESPLELLGIDVKDAPLSQFWLSSLTDVCCLPHNLDLNGPL